MTLPHGERKVPTRWTTVGVDATQAKFTGRQLPACQDMADPGGSGRGAGGRLRPVDGGPANSFAAH